MAKLNAKQRKERSDRFADWQYVIGFSCPACASNQVLMSQNDHGKLHDRKTKLGCWDCGNEFNVDESRWYMDEWRRVSTSRLSDMATEKQVSGKEASSKRKDWAGEAPSLDIVGDGIATDKAVDSENVPQPQKAKKQKKANG